MEKLIGLYPFSEIFVILPVWTNREEEKRAVGTLEDIRREISGICRRFPRVKVINGLSLVPNTVDYFSDGIHPNDHDDIVEIVCLANKSGVTPVPLKSFDNEHYAFSFNVAYIILYTILCMPLDFNLINIIE